MRRCKTVVASLIRRTIFPNLELSTASKASRLEMALDAAHLLQPGIPSGNDAFTAVT